MRSWRSIAGVVRGCLRDEWLPARAVACGPPRRVRNVNDIALRDIVAFLVRWRGWLAVAVLLGAAGNLGWSVLAPDGHWRLARVDAVIAVTLPDSQSLSKVAVRAEPFMDRAQVVALLGSRRLAASIVDAPWYAEAMDVRALDRAARVEQLMHARRSLREDRATGLLHLQVRAPTGAAALRIARAHVDVANALIVADAVRARQAMRAAVDGVPAGTRLAVEWRALESTTVARSVDLLRWTGERPPVRAVDLLPDGSTPTERVEIALVIGLAGALAGWLLGLLLAFVLDQVRTMRHAPRHAG